MALSIFEIIDISVLAILIISLSIFLYKKRKNLVKDGILVLYKTKWGLNLIDRVGKKYKKSLKFLSYISIVVGYVLMIGIVYLFGQTVYQYLTNPEIIKMIRAPPLAPLIPYFPRLFGLQEFFPNFFAIYFVISILIVATVHEFAHGIFARRWGIKIKSTGFAFLKFFPAIFGAFVEQDEKDMVKKSKFSQMSILSAGVFANIITAILFYIILILFFMNAFTPSGVFFIDYSYSVVGITSITMINNVTLNNPTAQDIIDNVGNKSLMDIEAGGKKYLGIKGLLNESDIVLYDDSPAINSGLIINSAITEINGVTIDSLEKLVQELYNYSPGEKVTFGIFDGESVHNQYIVIGENPNNKSLPWIGIVFSGEQKFSRISGKIYQKATSFKKSEIYYKERYKLSNFIFYMIWWITIINFLVGLMNMLPVGIFDGGRFFYLTVLGITKSEKIAKRAFSVVTYLFLFLLLVLMIFWATSFIR